MLSPLSPGEERFLKVLRVLRGLKVLRFGRDVLACVTSAASDGYRFEGSVVLELAC